MTPWSLSIRSLCHYWRTNVAVGFGVMVATAVCVGSFAVGDSVRNLLRRIADARLGLIETVILGGDRFFTESFAGNVAEQLDLPVAPVVILQGSVAVAGNPGRVSQVQIVGVTDAFWGLAPPGATRVPALGADTAVLNDHLAARLDASPGDVVVLRVRNPGSVPGDAPLSSDRAESVALRMTVEDVVGEDGFGRFSLRANQLPPDTVFVPRRQLQDAIGRPGRINLVLMGASGTHSEDGIREVVRRNWRLDDSELIVSYVESANQYALSSPRVFLDGPIERAALEACDEAIPVLTYFVNEITAGTNATPYSMVAAVPEGVTPWVSGPVKPAGGLPPIVINEWLAEDLDAVPGDEVLLKYYVVGPYRALSETSSLFRVSSVVPLDGAAADPGLMPLFPGLGDADNCSDWDPSFPVDLSRIRDRDEVYWDEYGGTPKAFVSYPVGVALWSNRFGRVTGIRFPVEGVDSNVLVRTLEGGINPFSTGIEVQDVKVAADAARSGAMNFGSLVLSFSSFLVVAALLLSGLLFVFGIESRASHIGLLCSIGFSPGGVGRLFLREGVGIAAVAGLVGVPVGILYTRVILSELSSAGIKVGGGCTGDFSGGAGSFGAGASGAFVLTLVVMFFCARSLARRIPAELLEGASGRRVSRATRGRRILTSRNLCLVLVFLALVAGLQSGGARQPAQVFFVAGMLMLLAGIAGAATLLRTRRMSTEKPAMTRLSLNWSGLCRRRGRSLTTVGLLACGCFMVVGATAHRLEVPRVGTSKSLGTGGFTHILELSRSFTRDLNDPRVQEDLGADPDVLAGAEFVPVRVKAGDDASCLNLNRAQQPRLLGVDPLAMAGRFSFAAQARSVVTVKGADRQPGADSWEWLSFDYPEGVIPAIADNNSILWAMGRKVGESLTYRDERGEPFEVKLTAGLANSMLQGSVLISERDFVRRYPSVSGHEVYFVQASGDVQVFEREVEFILADYGVEIISASERLAEFHAVQNTYLAMFQVLGAFGVLIGSVGLGVVVLRNVLERRPEFGLMRAMGWTRADLVRSVVAEHAVLLGMGCAIGLLSAAVGVIPSLTSQASPFPYQFTVLAVGAILLNGLLWTAVAAHVSMSGPFLASLREE